MSSRLLGFASSSIALGLIIAAAIDLNSKPIYVIVSSFFIIYAVNASRYKESIRRIAKMNWSLAECNMNQDAAIDALVVQLCTSKEIFSEINHSRMENATYPNDHVMYIRRLVKDRIYSGFEVEDEIIDFTTNTILKYYCEINGIENDKFLI